MFQRLGLALFILGAAAAVAYGDTRPAGKKVLYYTHEPGHWHKYTPQLAIFRGIAKEAGWELTVMTGDHDAQIERLRTPEYGRNYDALVYNFCFPESRDLESADNLMRQTREFGVPALLLHCAMHSWWDTYKRGEAGALGPNYKGHAKADPQLVTQWRAAHPQRRFPAWGDFTGLASTRHGRLAPIRLERLSDHPATRRFPDNLTTGATELYNNVYRSDEVVPLIRGTQDGQEHVVMWTCPQGASQVMCLTIGHDVQDWLDKSFQHLVIDGVEFLMNDSGAHQQTAK